MKGMKLVSDFLKDSGMPLIERRHVYVMLDANGKIVWLVGLRADDRFRLTASTSEVLRISMAI